LTAGFLLWLLHRPLPWESEADSKGPTLSPNALKIREDRADRTYWAKEILSEQCGRTFEALWDSVNASTNKLSVLAGFRFGYLLLPQFGPLQDLPHGIELRAGTGPGRVLSPGQWRETVEKFQREGWQLDNLEFRHNAFDTDTNGQPSQSRFYFAARLTNPAGPVRAMLEGDLAVDWATNQPGQEPAFVSRIDASHLQLETRAGEPPFERILNEKITPRDRLFIDPLIVYDLDGDGRSEIILAGNNQVYRRTGEGRYESRALCRYPVDFIGTALIADFDGDGHADLLCATPRGLFLFTGSPQGTFDEPPRLVWAPSPPLKNPMVMTCGDVDEDGHLDVFIGQYRAPTLGQILRPHYYDANDGWPGYLLLNDGHGNFTDATESAGLVAKRGRRIYSAALVDLDGDGHLDLCVASDFAGLDLYKGTGHGHFTEVTGQWVAEPHAFGMAQAFADFNADGRLDLLMIGMPSATADRLEHLGLWRPYPAEDRQMRSAMSFGNRLYLAKADGGFEQTPLSGSIARSGWSWGCAVFDFDNDGFPDVYIANGLESKQSVRDYESEFWLHDIFVGEDIDDLTATRYFMDKFSRTRGSGWSYGGYEKNRLYLNRHGESFVEIGHLAGVALEQDSRNVVADDLDGDGRMDLLVTTLEVWPAAKQTLQVYKNRLGDTGHWIGFHFREQGDGKSPVGVRVTIHYAGHSAVRQIVTGDSHRSQHANTIHFGLGATTRVDRAEIRWGRGPGLTLGDPAVDRYHDVSEPPELVK
jgi:hypothetical protein